MTAVPEVDVVTDAELALAAAAGDRAAFAGIYDRYADRLYDFCVGMVRDRNAAADCVQDTFCTAATRLASLREPDKLRPWLYAIARNEALRCIRERRREEPSDELPEASSNEPSPDTLAARSELAELVAQAAGGLSERDRTVLELTYRHGLDGPELAEALGVSAASARTLTHRLRETVERSLGALLVMRTAKAGHGCGELAASMKDWDGQFTVLTRKRIARHIDSCLTCEASRRQMVSRQALLGAAPVFIPAPDALRQRTLDDIRLCSAGSALTGPAAGGAAAGSADAPAAVPPNPAEADEADSAAIAVVPDVLDEPSVRGGATSDQSSEEDKRRRRRAVLALFLLLALAVIAALSLARPFTKNAPPAPAGVTETSGRPAPISAAKPTSPAPPSTPPPPPVASTPTPAPAPPPTYQQPAPQQTVPPAPPQTAAVPAESEAPWITSIRPTPPRGTAPVLTVPRGTGASSQGNPRSNSNSSAPDTSGSPASSGGPAGTTDGTSDPPGGTSGTSGGASDTSGGTSGPAGQPGPGSTAPPR